MTKTKRGSKSGDAVVDHRDCGSRVRQLEEENKAFQKENEELRNKLANVSSPPGDSSQKIREEYLQKLILLEDQVAELKKKLDAKSQLSIQRPKGDEATKRLNFEIQSLKAQKVQLQCKMKLESLQFRSYKASKEKEVLQLRKDGRRNQFETCKLLDSNQRLNMVLQRKTIEASMATKRLKELLESRKSFTRKRVGVKHIPRLQGLEYDLEVSTKLHELCSEYERQMELMAEEIASHKEEVEVLKQENLTSLLQEKEADITKDLDIKDLNEQIASLSGLFKQLRQQRAELDSSNKSQGVPSQSSLTSIRSNQLVDITTSGSKCSRPSKSASGVCCSCSKKSLCKTTKCQCRQNGGSCGASCGCTAAKCTNREAVQIQLSNSPQSQITEGKVDCSTIVEPAKNTTEDASQIALVEKPAEMNDNNLSTKPLSDIGNMLVKRNDTRPGQRKKGGKAVIQVVSEVAPSSTTTNSTGGGSKEAGKNKKIPRTTRSKVATSE